MLGTFLTPNRSLASPKSSVANSLTRNAGAALLLEKEEEVAAFVRRAAVNS